MTTTTVLDKTITTELEVVNAMLDAVEIAPVTSITGSVDLEVENAINRFSGINRSIQTKGWAFNTRLNVLYVRNVDGEVSLGSNILSIKPVGNSGWKDLVKRGSKLYDRTRDTSVLDADVYLDIVELVNFEDLPQSARDYIALRSVRVHELMNVSDEAKRRITEQMEIEAWSTFINDQSREGYLTIENNVNVFSSIFGRE